MSGPIFWLPVVKMSWEKNSKKKPMLLINFYFMIHFDFYNTKIFSFSIGSKVMNPKMPLCIIHSETATYERQNPKLVNNSTLTLINFE